MQLFSTALIEIWNMCCQTRGVSFCQKMKKHTYTLEEFQDTELKHLQEVHLYIYTKKQLLLKSKVFIIYAKSLVFVGLFRILSFLLLGIDWPWKVSWPSQGGYHLCRP